MEGVKAPKELQCGAASNIQNTKTTEISKA
jgi:hypothetical protein